VHTKNPARGPLLIIDGEKDHTVPWAIAHAAYKRQKHNPGVTEIVKIPNRGHALTIDHGWREVAQTALDFVEKSLRGVDMTEAAQRDGEGARPRLQSTS
jgi:pimeloyl-ACP methyl ester carboxylesterase